MAVSSPLIDIVLPLSTNKYNVNVYHTRKVFDTDVNGRLASQIVVNIFLNQTVDIRNKINSSSTLSRPSQSSNISFLSQVINTFCRVWTTQGSAHRWFYPYICLHHITFKIAISRYLVTASSSETLWLNKIEDCFPLLRYARSSFLVLTLLINITSILRWNIESKTKIKVE